MQKSRSRNHRVGGVEEAKKFREEKCVYIYFCVGTEDRGSRKFSPGPSLVLILLRGVRASENRNSVCK